MNSNGKSSRISILGCGWLGFALGKDLVKKGWQVNGSTTTSQKLETMEKSGINPFLITLETSKEQLDINFLNTDFLLINIPPGRKAFPGFYLPKMQSLLPCIEASSVTKVIFISSTSVYADVCREVTEANEPENPSELLQTEKLFLSSKNFYTTIIRFGGLFGPDRNPGRFFKGKNSIPNSLAPVNLIHLTDCLGLIEAVLNQDKFPGIFNAVAPSHPTKKEFYTKAIQQSGFPPPEFLAEKTEWKMINPGKIITELKYQFVYPDLLACLKDENAF